MSKRKDGVSFSGKTFIFRAVRSQCSCWWLELLNRNLVPSQIDSVHHLAKKFWLCWCMDWCKDILKLKSVFVRRSHARTGTFCHCSFMLQHIIWKGFNWSILSVFINLKIPQITCNFWIRIEVWPSVWNVVTRNKECHNLYTNALPMYILF